MRKHAFTLVELLVVVAIIALLLAILLPALDRAKKAARTVICNSSMRQAALGTIQYASDYNGYLPPGGIETSNVWNALMVVQDYMFPTHPAYTIGWGNNDWPGKSTLYCPSWGDDNRGASGRYSYAFVNDDDGGFATYYNGDYINGKGPINSQATFAAAGGFRRYSEYATSRTGMFLDHTTWRSPKGFLNVYSTSSQRMRFPHLGETGSVVYMDGHSVQHDREWAFNLQNSNSAWRDFACNGLNF